MSSRLSRKLVFYQITAIFSVAFALTGFSYNVWRMEVTESNSNIRTASFEMLTELAALEQLVYTAVYDNDLDEGSPRKGWVKVGLIADLSVLTGYSVEDKASHLKQVWSENWSTMTSNKVSTEAIVQAIDSVRSEIKTVLESLD